MFGVKIIVKNKVLYNKKFKVSSKFDTSLTLIKRTIIKKSGCHTKCPVQQFAQIAGNIKGYSCNVLSYWSKNKESGKRCLSL